MKTALSAILLSLSLQAHAMLFEWSGTCTLFCTGVAHAEFTVSDSYVPGTPWSCGFGGPCVIQDILYFDNTTSAGSATTPAGPWRWAIDHPFGNGRFPSSPFDPGFIRFGLGDSVLNGPFWSNSLGGGVEDPLGVGTWLAGEFPSRAGIGGRFSTAVIPEPGTLALIALFLMRVMRRAE